MYQSFTYKQPETQLQLRERRKTEQRDQVRRFRTRAKNQQIKDGVRDTEGKLVVTPKDARECLLASGHATNTVAVNDWAVISNEPRPVKKVISTTLRDTDGNVYPPKARVHINWFSPALWPAIDAAAKLHKFNVINALRYLKARDSMENRFAKLSSSTMRGWIDKTAKPPCWLPKVYTRGAQCWVPGKGKISALQKYPQLILHIKDAILSIRAAALPINGPMARNLMLGFIRTECPQLLKEMADAVGKLFECLQILVLYGMPLLNG